MTLRLRFETTKNRYFKYLFAYTMYVSEHVLSGYLPVLLGFFGKKMFEYICIINFVYDRGCYIHEWYLCQLPNAVVY